VAVYSRRQLLLKADFTMRVAVLITASDHHKAFQVSRGIKMMNAGLERMYLNNAIDRISSGVPCS